jgi:hypothetical protein
LSGSKLETSLTLNILSSLAPWETKMDTKQFFWIHPASFTYREDRPYKLIETLWVERPGWGYIRRRDLWAQSDCSAEELQAEGYTLRRPDSDDRVRHCPFCGMYICDIPGYLTGEHFSECGGSAENWQAQEETLIADQRIKKYEAKIMAQKLQELADLKEAEKRERYDKIKEEMSSRQLQKDRKKRLKEETKQDWKKR